MKISSNDTPFENYETKRKRASKFILVVFLRNLKNFLMLLVFDLFMPPTEVYISNDVF